MTTATPFLQQKNKRKRLEIIFLFLLYQKTSRMTSLFSKINNFVYMHKNRTPFLTL